MSSSNESVVGCIGAVVVVVFTACLIALVMAVPVYYLWNWIMPNLLTVPLFKEITLWQALGLSLLCSFLFKSSHTSKK